MPINQGRFAKNHSTFAPDLATMAKRHLAERKTQKFLQKFPPGPFSMDAKTLTLGLLTLCSSATWASGCATDPSYGAGCGGGYPQASTSTPEIDYNYGYGTRTDVYLRGDGQIQVYEHMSSGPSDEVRVYDWQNQESTRQGRQLQPGVRRLWGQ